MSSFSYVFSMLIKIKIRDDSVLKNSQLTFSFLPPFGFIPSFFQNIQILLFTTIILKMFFGWGGWSVF